MCGIILAINTHKKEKSKPVNNFIINQYEDQYSRGKEGFGIIRLTPDNFEIDRATEPYKFLINLYQKESAMMIVHHRTPTSTVNKISQTHPILVSNKYLEHDYLVIHNGVIYNAEENKKEHEKLGFKYQTELKKQEESEYSYYRNHTFNDSESLAVEMSLFIENKIKEIRTRGSMAFIALQIERKTQKPLQVFFGRKDNPLNMYEYKGKTKSNLRLSSEGIGEPIKESLLYSFKISDKQINIKKTKMKFVKLEEKKEETKIYTSWLEEEKTKTTVSNNLVKKEIKTEVINEFTQYFKEQIKNKDVLEIEEITEENLEYLELEIMETISDFRNAAISTKGIKTGEFKGRICTTLDEIKKIIIASQAEIALAETKETAQEFIDWKKEDPVLTTEQKEMRGRGKMCRLGF